MNPHVIRDKDLFKFTRKFCVLILLTLAAHFIELAPIAYTLSVIAQLAIFGFHFISFKEFKSAFLNLVLTGLFLCLVGEGLLLVDTENDKYFYIFWAYLGVHMLRNIIFTIAFVWNIKKSIFNNQWIGKILSFVLAGGLFALFHFTHYENEYMYEEFFIAYNAVACFMILTAALRNNHTSPEGFWLMLLGCLLFVFSDICYLGTFSNGAVWVLALRTFFLMVGSIIVLSAGVHHVLYFKLKIQQMMYMATTEGTELVPKKGKRVKAGESFEKQLDVPLV